MGPLAQMVEQGTLNHLAVVSVMSNDFDFSQWITTQEAARLTGYSQTYIGRLLKQGRLDGVKLGHDWIVKRDSVLAFYQEMQSLGKQKHNAYRATDKV